MLPFYRYSTVPKRNFMIKWNILKKKRKKKRYHGAEENNKAKNGGTYEIGKEIKARNAWKIVDVVVTKCNN